MQTTAGKDIQIECQVAAALDQVYRAFTHSTALREWLCDYATAIARPGGRFYVAWNEGYYAAGSYNSLTANQAVSFTWLGRDDPGQTQVQVTFSEHSGGTQVRLVHTGFGQGEHWEKACNEIERGWNRGLENLASVVGSGPDLRITRRPMMGILFTDFSPEVAKTIGVPVSEGVRIEGTIEGLSARKAGLSRNDVVVSFDGTPVRAFEDFGPVMSKHRSGDSVKVGYYRGNVLQEAEMVLAARPIPEFPSNPADLAAAVKQIFDTELAELETSLAGSQRR